MIELEPARKFFFVETPRLKTGQLFSDQSHRYEVNLEFIEVLEEKINFWRLCS